MKHRPRPPEQDDLLRPRLVDMIDMRHELVKLSRGVISRTSDQLEGIRQTLIEGVRHYRSIASQLNESSRRPFVEHLDSINRELEQMVTGLTPAVPDPLIP